MEKGVKNLASASRTANRRGTGTDEDDSGIGMEDAENEVDLDQPSGSGGAIGQQAPPVSTIPKPFYSGGPTIASMLAPSSSHS